MENFCTAKPIQPYFVLKTKEYNKRIVMKDGISHFYGYKSEFQNSNRTIAIPDGCIDVLFDIAHGRVAAQACGTVLEHKSIENMYGHEYFGVRFLPGELPSILNVKFEELVNNEVNLEDITKDKSLCEQIINAPSFDEKTNVFLKSYKRYITTKDENYTKLRLFNSLKQMIYNTKGNIKVNELEQMSGYSTRYINKIFHENVGVNPKTFCTIIRFQSLLDQLNHDDHIKLVDLAIQYGYYDQPQFIRIFRKYTDMTPVAYRRLIRETDYINRINIKTY